MPDDALTALAAGGRLRESGVLKAEVRRMLADPKSTAFVENFVGQWLVLRNLEHHSVAKERFPTFNERLRADMRREVELFFGTIVREDRSLLELLDSDYTFANERLAKLYGIDGVSGDEFRRVSLEGTPRGGVTTMAGVLTVTAMPSRTSPVKRGKFILEQLFASPPPPQPANTPPLKDRRDDGANGGGRSVRQRFEAHRADPSCAACHTRMDPIGFAMENFDAVGKWRDRDGGAAIDTTGIFPDGTRFEGIAGLKRELVRQPELFVGTVAERLLMYAVGRNLQYYDAPAVRSVLREASPSRYTLASLVLGVVKSRPFQFREESPAQRAGN
jgi:hypothetical protein